MQGPAGPPQRSNGVPWAPGFVPLTLMDIAKILFDHDYPKELILHPIDFLVLTSPNPGNPNGIQPNVDDARAMHYVYIGNTRVYCRAPKDEVLDLSDRASQRVVLAGPGGMVTPVN